MLSLMLPPETFTLLELLILKNGGTLSGNTTTITGNHPTGQDVCPANDSYDSTGC